MILVRPADGTTGFRQAWPGCTPSSVCVWEMATMSHKRNAWERYLLSARDDEATRSSLNAQVAGPTWALGSLPDAVADCISAITAPAGSSITA